ncbi:MAG: TonB-dependent receptor [Flavobacteriaceae bacterium]|nr:TonB-dependent receptor [Flavobacteriaceae bacterium]
MNSNYWEISQQRIIPIKIFWPEVSTRWVAVADAKYLGSLELSDSSIFESEDLPEEYLPANFNVEENVYAGYAMINQDLSDKFSILVGIRLEHTKIDSKGNEIIFNEDGDYEGTSSIKDSNSYTNFLPGIHLKYDIRDNTILRFAWTNTLARPNYVDLVPFREINNEDEEIFLGNSGLDPTTSSNFDLMAEHYLESIGVSVRRFVLQKYQGFYLYISV